jgi:hypothetical protein
LIITATDIFCDNGAETRLRNMPLNVWADVEPKDADFTRKELFEVWAKHEKELYEKHGLEFGLSECGKFLKKKKVIRLK